MKTGFSLFKKALEEICSDSSVSVDVLECSVSFDKEGNLARSSDAPIQIRFVGYPQRAKNDSAVN